MPIRLTPKSSLIMAPLFAILGIVQLSMDAMFRGAILLLISVFLLIGGLVQRPGGTDEASEKLQRRRRERFGKKR